MKDFYIRIAFLAVVLLVLPLMFICFNDEDKTEEADKVIIKLYDDKTDVLSEIELEEYIVGVLAAEMPASFHKEALNAQAVCARTYALRKINKNLPEHKGGDVCTDYAHCQAYCSYEKMKEKWGKDFGENYEKIRNSVFQTKGEVITYNGEYAISVFHSCSNGKTEAASDVWGGEYPYLVSVDSEGDFEKKDYYSVSTVPKEKFVAEINKIIDTEILPEDDFSVSDIKMTIGDNVYSLKIGNSTVLGTEMRKLFSLKSTAFTIEENDGEIVFSVFGNGHGVGMSQYGANEMAKNGVGYESILKHYYRGVELKGEYNLP